MDNRKAKSNSIVKAKLKFIDQPIRKINRYSSVSTSMSEENQYEEALEEESCEREDHEIIALKGMRLITLRLEKNITQKELSEALEIDKTLISKYEGEISKPPYATVKRIADFFGVSVNYLTDNPVNEVVSYQETKDLFRDTKRDKVLPEKGLRPEYLAIAEEIQDAGIEIEDVRAFITMIKKYKG